MANDFSGDPNCKALWRLEDGALTTDSKGTNTLTNVNVEAYTVGYKEGAGCGDFSDASGDYMYRADAGLDSGFPGKNGESNANFSISFWMWMSISPATASWDYIVTKWDSANNKRTYAVAIHRIAGTDYLELLIGYGGGISTDMYTHASALLIGQWYHVGVTWNDSTKAYVIRVWDDTAGATLGVDKTGTGSNQMNIEDALLVIGDRSDFNANFTGYLDEVVIFNDILTSDEIDEIRNQTFGGGGGGGDGGLMFGSNF